MWSKRNRYTYLSIHLSIYSFYLLIYHIHLSSSHFRNLNLFHIIHIKTHIRAPGLRLSGDDWRILYTKSGLFRSGRTQIARWMDRWMGWANVCLCIIQTLDSQYLETLTALSMFQPSPEGGGGHHTKHSQRNRKNVPWNRRNRGW